MRRSHGLGDVREAGSQSLYHVFLLLLVDVHADRGRDDAEPGAEQREPGAERHHGLLLGHARLGCLAEKFKGSSRGAGAPDQRPVVNASRIAPTRSARAEIVATFSAFDTARGVLRPCALMHR